MLRFDLAESGGGGHPPGSFVLYVEGPRDQGILDGWCRGMLPALAARLSRCSVILGGRRPARALEHFRSLGGAAAGRRALCVLDRDDGRGPTGSEPPEPGLEIFTWGRRHIESYLLVPDAIRRGLRLAESDGRVDRVLRDHLPARGDEAAYRELDAKRLLAPRGPLARALGAPLPLARIARATRAGELHADVHGFFERVRGGLGEVETTVVR
jgi:hypothetical protein